MLPIEVTLFLRLIFGLFVDYLIAKGFLLPSQKDQWVEGMTSVIGAGGAAVLLAIYQYSSHKKDLLNRNQPNDISTANFFSYLFDKLKAFVFKPKTAAIPEQPIETPSQS